MSWKTPSSLKWLIRKHSLLQGTLLVQEKEAAAIQAQLEVQLRAIDETKLSLLALERTLGMHEIQVSAEDISSVVPRAKRPNYVHGSMTRDIYTILGKAGGWVDTNEIIERATGLTRFNTEKEQYVQVRRMFRSRLKGMCRLGKVDRQISERRGGVDQAGNRTLWRLPP
ncbi:MAG: hypothetical protein JSR63_05775 [Proteobacteria bacterium]|nr:hypothetical protein [Pseudomonadota bacterium]